MKLTWHYARDFILRAIFIHLALDVGIFKPLTILSKLWFYAAATPLTLTEAEADELDPDALARLLDRLLRLRCTYLG